MKTIFLADLQHQVSLRKAELGMRDTPEAVDAMRNKGDNRTEAKRELLHRIAERTAKAQGTKSEPQG
jgi:hypothetical protein